MILKSLRTYFNDALLGYYPDTEIQSFFYMLSERLLNMKRIDVSQNLYSVVSGKKYDKFQTVIDRLKHYEPIQYILGDTEFYGLVFKVTPAVLIPRPETEELVDWVVNDFKGKQEISILDIGTGSGCIAIALAKNLPKAKIYALDISKEAIAVAKKNAIDNKVDVEFIEANILNCDLGDVQFDVIVSNPPYVRKLEKEAMNANVLQHEPHLALFVDDDDALKFYRAICQFSVDKLKEKGMLFFEINAYLGNQMKLLLQQYTFKNIELKQDMFGKDRMIKAEK